MSIVTDVLRKAATKKSTKPSTDMVEIPVTPGLLTKHKEKYDAAKAAKADLELSEEQLLGEVSPVYVERLREQYVNSARLNEDNVEATVSWKDAYSKIPVEKIDEIKELVGDKYDEFFKEVNEIVVREDVASNPNLLEELIREVGPDKFSKYFDVAQHVKPTTRFTEERHRTLSPEVNTQLDVTVRQYKPSVRIKAK
jgi:hypothetical protein